jgi:hypothetical protein
VKPHALKEGLPGHLPVNDFTVDQPLDKKLDMSNTFLYLMGIVLGLGTVD